ncbi:MAG: hypothetical protein QOG16_1305 [Actinomycetota bacterium]|jgi:hypothetical protein|nr:hypothetical protein [Actinomycetota bacterium]
MRSMKGIAAGAVLVLMVVAGLAVPSGAVELPGHAHEEAVLHTHGPDGLDMDPRLPRTDSPFEVDLHAPWNTADYDNQLLTSDAKPDQTSLPTFHAIYMYPRDGVNRFSQYAAMFQADARQASQRLRDWYGRGVRWDERSCTLASGTTTCLDITIIKSSSRSSQLAGNPFSAVDRELSKVIKDTTKKYVVWLDTPYAGACGQGHLYQDTRRSSANYNERRTLAIIYRPYDDDAEGGFCRGRTLLHEMGHNMGAVQIVSPRAFDGAHCNDSAEDVMCYKDAANNLDTGPAVFDYMNNDYWDPIADPTSGSTAKLTWWTVNLSKFICPTAGCQAANTPQY